MPFNEYNSLMNNTKWEEIRLEIKVDNEETKNEVINILRKIHVLGEILKNSIKVYGYKRDKLNKSIASQNAICIHNLSPSGSREGLYQDIFFTLLEPYINKSIKDYYGSSYSFKNYNTDILDAKRPNGDRTAFSL